MHTVLVKPVLAPQPASPHLALVHRVAEELIQQQVLQLCVAVEGLPDLTQKHTEDTRMNQGLDQGSARRQCLKVGRFT